MLHTPVLCANVVSLLQPASGAKIVDSTFGGGGHTKALFDCCEDIHVFAIDRDPAASVRASAFSLQFGDRFRFFCGNFSKISEILAEFGKFDGILFDFGTSSFQLDDERRGFSFLRNGPIDMRMSQSGVSAYDIVNSLSEEDLVSIMKSYGNEKKADVIASFIIQKRKSRKIETTQELREIIHEAIGFSHIKKKFSKIDSATKTFQALRIFVNDELKEIDQALHSISKILKKGARVVTISFHELEDRIVKNWAKAPHSIAKPINKKVIKPGLMEIKNNPRARSAVLRGFIIEQ
jgi:16S rRNA (cytosine1402-N4)-methyltransferase